MDAKSRAAIMSRIDGSRVYDLSVDYFLGMPSFQAAGDPAYQMWMTHTPRGTVVDNLNGQGKRINSCCGYSGDVILMYTHTGTHIDSLNHFGYGRKIYNGFDADEHLGSRAWQKGGSEQIVPIISRGLLLDIAACKGVECLSPVLRHQRRRLPCRCQETGRGRFVKATPCCCVPAACDTGRTAPGCSATALA